MTTPTAADRAKAAELLTDSGIPGGYGPRDSYVRDIAQALADAREEGRRSVGSFLRAHLQGSPDDVRYVTCERCSGVGAVRVRGAVVVTCPACDGDGEVPPEEA